VSGKQLVVVNLHKKTADELTVTYDFNANAVPLLSSILQRQLSAINNLL